MKCCEYGPCPLNPDRKNKKKIRLINKWTDKLIYKDIDPHLDIRMTDRPTLRLTIRQTDQ